MCNMMPGSVAADATESVGASKASYDPVFSIAFKRLSSVESVLTTEIRRK